MLDGIERRVRYIGANESVKTISAEIEKLIKSKEEKSKFDKLNMPYDG